MKKEILEKYQGKKVRIFLLNNRIYTGEILSVEKEVCFVKDKFGLDVTISNEAVQHLEVLERSV